jgi:hypothetical protein
MQYCRLLSRNAVRNVRTPGRQTAIRPPKPDSLPVLALHSCKVLHTRYCTPEVRRFHSGSRCMPLICAHNLCVCVCVCVWERERYCLGEMAVPAQRDAENCLDLGLMRHFVIRTVYLHCCHVMGGTCSTNEGDWKDNVMFCAKFVCSS